MFNNYFESQVYEHKIQELENKVAELENKVAELEKTLKEKDRSIQDIIESLPDIQQAEWCSMGKYTHDGNCGVGYFSGCIEDCSLCAENYFKKPLEQKLAEMKKE